MLIFLDSDNVVQERDLGDIVHANQEALSTALISEPAILVGLQPAGKVKPFGDWASRFPNKRQSLLVPLPCGQTLTTREATHAGRGGAGRWC